MRPNSPRCVPFVRARYWSNPPCFFMDRMADVATRVLMLSCSVSLQSVARWIFGIHLRGVLCRDLGILLPNWMMRPSYRPRCARLNVWPACAAITSVGRDAIDERASVRPERPAPDPRTPRYVVRDHRTSDANILPKDKALDQAGRCLLRHIT